MERDEADERKYSKEKWLLGFLVVAMVAFVVVRVLILIRSTGAF